MKGNVEGGGVNELVSTKTKVDQNPRIWVTKPEDLEAHQGDLT